MNHRSLAFRLAVWYALLLSGTFLLVGATMFYGLGQYLRSTLADSLRRRSTQIEQILQEAPADTTSAAIGEAIETRVAPEFNNRFVRVARAPDQQVYRSGTPADRSFDAALVPPLPLPWPLKSSARHVETPAHESLMISATQLQTRSGRYLIELGASLEPVETVEAHLLGLLGLLLPVLVVCATSGGYLLVGRALRPGRPHLTERRAHGGTGPGGAAAGSSERRCDRAPVDFAQPYAGEIARIDADLAPIPGRCLA